MKKLAIIIVNYNTKDILRDCLKNLEYFVTSSVITPHQVIVVDNASKDGSADMVEAEFEGVDLIRATNKGLASSYNLGMTQAADVDYYLFLGTDAFPKLGCIEGVIDFMEAHRDIGIATAKLVLRSGLLDMDAHRGFPAPWTALTHFACLDRLFPKSRIFNRYFLGGCDMNKPHEIDLCISHFMMVKREVFAKVGVWDEDFFVYGEDVDFCWRVKQAGFKIYYLPQFQCLHYKGVSVGTRRESADVTKADSATKSRMKAETTRAMRLFYQKHMSKKYPWVLNKTVELGISVVEKVRTIPSPPWLIPLTAV